MNISVVYTIIAAAFSGLYRTTAFVQRGAFQQPLHHVAIKQVETKLSRKLTSCRTFTTSMLAQRTNVEKTKTATIGPSVFFLSFAGMLGNLVHAIQNSSLPITVGTSSLLFVSASVAYDNLIIGLGDILFPEARTNDTQYTILKWLSYPRFVLHASGVPFLSTTVAEIGQYSGVEWLDNILIQNGIVGVSIVVALASRVEFFRSPGIELKDTSDSPPNALERQLLWFTYKEPEFIYVLPSLLLALWSLVVGVCAFRLDGDAHAAGVLLIASAVGVLAGNAQKSFVARFTGNFAEVIMLWCMFVAASYVM